VVCGGEDLGGIESPSQLAEVLVRRVQSRAKVVVFCGVPLRKPTEKGSKVPENFRELAHQFDKRLAELANGSDRLVYWRLDPRLRRCLSTDGVHFNEQGQRRFFYSLCQAIQAGKKALEGLQVPNTTKNS